MIVKEIMKTNVGTCAADADLAMVTQIMQERDCGFVPIVDSKGTVIGVVTDRDVCRAAGMRRRPLTRISASETMSHPVYACFPDENVKVVLATMSKHHVRRLPVLDKQHGHLQGVLSIDDVLHAPHRRGAPTTEEIVDALKAICAPRTVEPAVA